MKKEIYLIRHSAPFIEIDNYNDYKNVNWDDYNRNMILSSEGENNAKKLCELDELKNIDEIYSSDSFRAIGTAKYIAEINNIKIKLDNRINERNLGIKTINDLPVNFSQDSFNNKELKILNGESLNEVDNRFNCFIKDILNSNNKKVVLSIHGIILMSFLQTICDFEFDGQKFIINFNGKEVMNRKLKNPDVFKLIYEGNDIIDIISLTN